MLKKDVILRRDQIRVLVSKDFKLKYNSTALGFLWSLVVPIMTGAVYYLVFGILMGMCDPKAAGVRAQMGANTPYFLLYLLCGTFLWQFFANVVMMNGGVVFANGPLLKKTSFDRELLIWGTFYSESFHFLLTIPVLLVVMVCNGIVPDWLTFVPNVVISLVALMFFSMGLSFAYAAVNIFFRDLERIMNILLMLWMFVSPVFISITFIQEKLPSWNIPVWVYNCNPMAAILQCWRDAFWTPAFLSAEAQSALHAGSYGFGLAHAWHPEFYLPMLAGSVVVYFLGRWLFRKMEPAFAEMM